MSTMIGKIKALSDNQILINGGASTVNGAAQAKGTATDLQLVILAGPLGTAAVGGTANIQVQGSQVTASAASNWTSVAPDKGTLPASYTTTGSTVVHFQNLQYANYRLQVTGTATADLRTVFNFMPVADSFDASAQ